MNGAVHGVAATTASAPVKNAPISPLLPRGQRLPKILRAADREEPREIEPDGKEEKRQRPPRTAAIAIENPSPTPARRRAARSTRRRARGRSAPRRRDKPAHARRASPAWAPPAKESALIAKTGSTHGITLRISPPRNAKAQRQRQAQDAPSRFGGRRARRWCRAARPLGAAVISTARRNPTSVLLRFEGQRRHRARPWPRCVPRRRQRKRDAARAEAACCGSACAIASRL